MAQNSATIRHLLRTATRTISLAGLLATTLLIPPAPSSAAGFVVTSTDDNGAGSLRDAVNQANATEAVDAITFTPGLSGTIVLTTNEVTVFDDLIIDGAAAPDLTISGNNVSRAFGAYGSDLELRNLNIRHGDSGSIGGAVFVDGNLTLRNVDIDDSEATTDGGGAYVTGDVLMIDSELSENSANVGGGLMALGSITIENSTVHFNTAAERGGGIAADGPLVVTGSDINGNSGCTTGSSNQGGGGISSFASVTISNSTIDGNTCDNNNGGGISATNGAAGAPPMVIVDGSSAIANNQATNGGGVHVLDVQLEVNNSSVSANSATLDGGGAVVQSSSFYTLIGADGPVIISDALATFTNATFADNTAVRSGGAVWSTAGQLTVTTSDFLDNLALAGGGGAIYAEHPVDITGGTVSGNIARSGGGLAHPSAWPLTITDTTFGENESRFDGGALTTQSDQFTVTGASFENNSAVADGGALRLTGTDVVELGDLTFVGNTTLQGGGAVHIMGFGEFTLRDSSIVGNSANESGGGLQVESGNTVIIERSTFDDNSAEGDGESERGGGASIQDTGSVVLTDTQFTANDAVDGGGLLAVGVGSISVNDSNFDGNVATEGLGGGAAFDADDIVVEGGSFTGNTAGAAGGLFIASAETVVLSALTVEANKAVIAGGPGGGIAIISSGTTDISDSTIERNTSAQGGGVYLDDNAGLTTVTDSAISQNVGTLAGGGILTILADLTIDSSAVDANSASTGGGIHARSGTLVLGAGTTVDDNTAATNAGGISMSEGLLTTSDGVSISRNTADAGQGGGARLDMTSADLGDTTVEGNSAGEDGGGMWSDGSMTIASSSIAGNTSAAEGGGIHATDSLSISNSSVVENDAAAEGGGVSAKSVTVNRSLFADNTAGTEHNGGAIRSTVRVVASNSTFHANTAGGTGGAISLDGDIEQGTAVLSQLTITDNSAGVAGGGVFATGNQSNSATGIIADGNTAPESPDIALMEAPTWSLVGDLGATPAVDRDGRPSLGLQVGLDPLLGPLADNGGPTLTRMPLPRSQVIDAGGTSPETDIDQRGIERPAESRLDIGAVEYDGPLPVWVPVTPARLVDTRSSGETIDGDFRGAGTLEPGDTLRVDIAGRGGVPASAAGVIVNVTAISPERVGFLTVYPCTDVPPNASSVNYTTGVNLPNEVIAGLDADGALCVFTSSRTQLAIDVVAYLGGPSPFTAVEPSRLLDTRQTGVTIDGQSRAGGRTPAGEQVTVQVTGRADIPDTAVAAVVNVIAVGPSATGYVTVHACADERPLSSSLNYIAGGNRGNEILAGLDDGGQLCVFTSSETDLVLDVVGYLNADLDVTAVQPARVFETRPGTPTVDGEFEGVGRLTAGSTARIQLAGRAGIGDDAATVNINVTAINADRNGYLTVFACGDRPLAASLNYVPGVNGGNDLISGIDADGALCVFTSADTDLTIDIAAYTTL